MALFGSSSDESALAKAIGYGDFTGEIVVDPETPLENLFSIPLMIGVTMVMGSGLILFLSMFKAIDLSLSVDKAWSYLFIGFILTPIGVYVRSLVDVHYVMNLDERVIYLNRRVFRSWSSKKICDFSEVDSILIDYVSSREKDTRYSDDTYVDKHRYGIKMLLKSGSTVRLLNRSYLDYSLVSERARFVGKHLNVKVSGEPGASNMGRSAFSASSIPNTCGVLLALLLLGTCSTRILRPEVFSDEAKKTAVKAPTKVPKAPNWQGSYAGKLRKSGDYRRPIFFENGMVEVKATESLWKAILQDDELSHTLARGADVVTAMAVKLKLPISASEESAGWSGWKGKVSVRIGMDFEPKKESLPILRRNLKLAFLRMNMGEPRGGKAVLLLRVLPEVKKPQVSPEEHGFTLVIPADHPIDHTALGLSDSQLKDDTF